MQQRTSHIISSACLLYGFRGTGLGSRRSISLEARAAPVHQAPAAPISPASRDRAVVANCASNGASDGASARPVAAEPSGRPSAGGPADVMQSADDDLDPDTIRAKSHEEVSTLCFIAASSSKLLSTDVSGGLLLCRQLRQFQVKSVATHRPSVKRPAHDRPSTERAGFDSLTTD